MDRRWVGQGISFKCRPSFHEGRNHHWTASNSNEIDTDNDGRDPGMLDVEIVLLLNSDTGGEDFNGFVEDYVWK